VGRAGGEVPAGAGDHPTAQGRELPRLREVSEGEPAVGQLPFDGGPGRTTLDPCVLRTVVDLQDPVEVLEVEADDRADVGRRGDPADHRGATAPRDDGDAVLGAPVEDPGDVGGVAGPHDQVRRGGDVAVQRADQLAEGGAVAVTQPVDGRVAGQLGEVTRWRHARSGHLDGVGVDGVDGSVPGRVRGPTESLGQHGADAVEGRAGEGLVVPAPAPPAARASGGAHADTSCAVDRGCSSRLSHTSNGRVSGARSRRCRSSSSVPIVTSGAANASTST
jgi:hypothetical protein